MPTRRAGDASWQWFEWRGHSLGARGAVCVEKQGNHIVVTHGADEIDCAALTESVDGGFKRGVADLFGFEEFVAEVVDDFFVAVHRSGAFAGGDGIDHGGVKAILEAIALVSVPLVLRSLESIGDEDGEFVKFARN